MKPVSGTLKLDLAQFRDLESFATFGSELDRASQAQLDRGYRLTELLKQPLNRPVPVEEQVFVIYAGTKGWTDTVPVSEVRRFETELLAFFQGHHPSCSRRSARPARCPDGDRARQGADHVPRRLRHGEGRLTHGRRPGARAPTADPQRPVDAEDHQGDGAHRRLADRARPGADRGQPPLPRGHGAGAPLDRQGRSDRGEAAPRHTGVAAPCRDPRRRWRPWPVRLLQLLGAPRRRATGRRTPERRRRGDGVVGRQEGRQLLPLSRHRHGGIVRGFADRPEFADARDVAAIVAARFAAGRSTRSCSSRCASAPPGSQVVETRQLLPLPPPEGPDEAPSRRARRGLHRVRARRRAAARGLAPRRSSPRSSPPCSRAPRRSTRASSARWPRRRRTPTSWSAPSPAR